MSGPLNSSRPTTAQIAGAVYNASTPAPVDQQAMALQVDDEGNLLVNVAVGGGGGSVTSKIEDSDGNPLLSNGAGALQVDVVNFPATQPVSGTVTANQGTASAGAKWSVEVDNASAIPVSLPTGQAVELLDSGGTNKASISAAGALMVDGSAVTQPISAVSLPLPANAAQETGGNLATIAAAQGTSGTGITFPTGGAGILGWLSGIYNRLAGIVLAAGSAIIGKVGIDQTTPGTTNLVQDAADGATGSVVPSKSIQVAGSDGTDLRTLATDTVGQLKVLVEGGAGIPVSGTVTADIVGHAGATLDGTAGSPSTGVLTVQGVSGGQTIPVTAAQATAANLKAEAILLDAGGTNLGTVKAASTAAAATDTSLVVQINPNQPNLTTALNVQAVSGSTTAVTQATAANLNATVVPGASAIFEVSPTTAANTNANPFFNSITDGTTKATVIAATAALKTDLSSVAGTATVAASAGIQKVGISGNAGASVDAVLGAAIPLNAILIGGSDGTDLRALATDTSGRQEVVGAAGSGSAVAGNPVLVGGSDGTDARTLLTDNTGQLKVLVENGSAIATTDLADGPVTAGTAAGKSSLGGAVYTSSNAALTTTQQLALQVDKFGNLRINNTGGVGSFSSATTSSSAGASANLTAPANTKWRVKSALISYTSSATAGSRFVSLAAYDASSNQLANAFAGFGGQGASTTVFYTFGPGLPQTTTALNISGVGFFASVPFPEVSLGPAAFLQVFISGGQTGDSMTAHCNIEVFSE